MPFGQKIQARILVLTSYDEDDRVTTAIQAGALGYLRKDTSADELFEAIRTVAKGASYLSPEIVGKLVRGLRGSQGHTQDDPGLTARELVVLAAIAKGMTNQQIADLLVIGVTTVRTHVRNILGKLGINNRTEAAVYAKQSGIL